MYQIRIQKSINLINLFILLFLVCSLFKINVGRYESHTVGELHYPTSDLLLIVLPVVIGAVVLIIIIIVIVTCRKRSKSKQSKSNKTAKVEYGSRRVSSGFDDPNEVDRIIELPPIKREY